MHIIVTKDCSIWSSHHIL